MEEETFKFKSFEELSFGKQIIATMLVCLLFSTIGFGLGYKVCNNHLAEKYNMAFENYKNQTGSRIMDYENYMLEQKQEELLVGLDKLDQFIHK